MRNKKLSLYYFFLILGLLAFIYIITNKISAENTKVNFTFLYSNSLNSYLEDCKCPTNPNGGIVRRATLIKEIRGKNKDVLLFDTGDIFSPDKNDLKAKYVLQAFTSLNYDAVCIGDQDLVNGMPFFYKVIEKLPIVNANFSCCENNVCHLIGNPYKIIDNQGMKIGILGVISPETFRFYPKEYTENIEIEAPIKAIQHYLEILKKECDIIVLLSHSGADEDQEIARKLDGIDIIIGGHTQSLITNTLIVNKTLIVQAGRNGEHLGELNFSYQKGAKQISDVKNTLHLLSPDVKDDPYIRNLIEEYYKKSKTRPFTHNTYNKKINIILYASSECESCKKVRDQILPELEKKYQFNFQIQFFDLEKPSNMTDLINLREKYHDTSNDIPVIIINDKMLSGVERIQTNLEKEIQGKK